MSSALAVNTVTAPALTCPQANVVLGITAPKAPTAPLLHRVWMPTSVHKGSTARREARCRSRVPLARTIQRWDGRMSASVRLVLVAGIAHTTMQHPLDLSVSLVKHCSLCMSEVVEFVDC